MPTIVVRADSETPLQNTIDMLTPAERQRLKVAGDGEPARYVLNNYHGFKEPDLSRYQGGYDLFYEIVIDGEVILSVFKRRA